MEDEVFSKLPRSRPAVRSPRRNAGEKPAAQAAAEPKRAPAKPKRAPQRAAAKPERPTEPRQAPSAEPAGAGGIEDLAKAGASAAFEAVGVGLRVGRWAIRGLRDTVERR